MSIKKWFKRIGLSISFLVSLALISGVIYEQTGRNKAKKYIENRTGTLIDVGGHKLYYEKKGEGDITVVFESGGLGDHRAWSFLADTISKYATTVTYDRAGMLWSERGTQAKNARNISQDLENLLSKINAPKPYVLVGHSAAGVYYRPFISEHQSDIQGVVLIDPSHPNQRSSAPEEIRKLMGPPFFPPKWVVSFVNEIGLPRLLSSDPFLFHSLKSGGAYDEINYIMHDMHNEMSQSPGEKWNIPLVVISAGNQDSFSVSDEVLKKKIQDHWDKLQIETSQLSSNGKRIVAEKSGHNMLYPERELITAEILKMIQIKDNSSLE